MSKLIYIVEEELNICEIITTSLKHVNFKSKCFDNFKVFFECLKIKLPDLIILDIMLPEKSGYEILKALKENKDYKNIPVIFLTAKSEEIDKVKGLDLGADDYITKPFGVLELISRVNAVIRRYNFENDLEEIIYKDLIINEQEKSVYKNNIKLNLTYKEYELLLFLIEKKGIAITREQLLLEVWEYSCEGETRTVDSHIRSLRKKIGDNGLDQKYIITVRGHGYMSIKD